MCRVNTFDAITFRCQLFYTSWHTAILSGPNTLVRGTLNNITSNETGVTVNDVPAMVYDNRFAANVYLYEGINKITAKAVDTDGNSAAAEIFVTRQFLEDYINISADPSFGVDPLETILSIRGSFDFATSSIAYTGPEEVEFLATGSDQYRVLMTTPGIYYFTVDVNDDQGYAYTDTIAVSVLDENELDMLLKTKWNSLKSLLENQDIEQALGYFAKETYDLYNDIYTAIYADLPQIAQDMSEIQLINVQGNLAKYRIRKDETHGSQTYTITYYLYFKVDTDGLWKILRY